MRLLIISDAWYPQINGVVRTLQRLQKELLELGHDVELIHPGQFRTLPCPTYPEIRLAIFPSRQVGRHIARFAPEAIHIATEGPLGLAARRYCLRNKLPFTTSYHTRFPEYFAERLPVPLDWVYSFVRKFHNSGVGTMVATASLRQELTERGFTRVQPWTRGVDSSLFRPLPPPDIEFPRPVFLSVGRVSVEKNLEAFLRLDLPGSKVVIGDGPHRATLERRFPGAHFLGAKEDEDLARHYALGDVFVFPSRTDTFGLVLLEALACGLPIAAYPVPGPLDVVGDSPAGILDEDLRTACIKALDVSKEDCLNHAKGFSWQTCTEQFISNLKPQATA